MAETTTLNPETTTEKRLVPLGQLSGYQVAAGYPDIRGWEIYGLNDAHLGEVKELIVDTTSCKARYIVAAIGRAGFLGLGKRREVIVPIGRARLDDNKDRVYFENLDATQLESFPDWNESRFDREQERSFFGANVERYEGADYDQKRLFGARGGSGEAFVVLHEEQVSFQKQPIETGEAVVQKTVETERVRQDVPVMRENVTVERRPVAPGADVSSTPSFQEDEVRIPLMGEQVTVEKQVVPTEEVIIKKTREQTTQAVEADVRKERADVTTNVEGTNIPKKEPV